MSEEKTVPDSEKSYVTVADGKYTFVKEPGDYRVHVLRHGEPWLVIAEGSNAIAALLGEFVELREEVATYHRLRPAVRNFAGAMEDKLRECDEEKGPEGWRGEDPGDLFGKMTYEMEELSAALDWLEEAESKTQDTLDDEERALVENDRKQSRENARTEAVDVANFCMMLRDVL